jgi:hypothetical protein
MKRFIAAAVSLLAVFSAAPVFADDPKYPPLHDYMMAREAEITLAKSAAPEKISAHATIRILTESGYQAAKPGDNGFVCMVMRGWAAPTFTPAQFRELVYDPTVRAPICFDPVATRTVLPYYELRTKLGMEGKDPDAIARGVAMAYALGELPKHESVAFAYMWSAHQHLASGVGAWFPHMMVFAPYYTNAMLGGNEFGGPAPAVTDDGGTPFTVVVIPVTGNQALGLTTAEHRNP